MPTPVHPQGGTGTRLAKRVAELQGCSRREAELLIEGGWVRVAGEVVEEPQRRVQDEAIAIDPQARPQDIPSVTLLLHKPPDLDAGTHEPVNLKGVGKVVRPAFELIRPAQRSRADRSPIQTLLKKHLDGQVLCLPLESAASGLVVYSQDWRVLRKLQEDAQTLEQEYSAEVFGTVDPATLARLHADTDEEGYPLPPARISIGSHGDGRTRLRCAIKGAFPGLIAYLCARAGLQLLSLKRIRIGRLPLAGLAEGEWRYLLPYERF